MRGYGCFVCVVVLGVRARCRGRGSSRMFLNRVSVFRGECYVEEFFVGLAVHSSQSVAHALLNN